MLIRESSLSDTTWRYCPIIYSAQTPRDAIVLLFTRRGHHVTLLSYYVSRRMRTLADHIGHAFELYFLFDPHLSPNRKLLVSCLAYGCNNLLPCEKSSNIQPITVLQTILVVSGCATPLTSSQSACISLYCIIQVTTCHRTELKYQR